MGLKEIAPFIAILAFFSLTTVPAIKEAIDN